MEGDPRKTGCRCRKVLTRNQLTLNCRRSQSMFMICCRACKKKKKDCTSCTYHAHSIVRSVSKCLWCWEFLGNSRQHFPLLWYYDREIIMYLCTATATLSCARAGFCFEYKTKLSVDPPTYLQGMFISRCHTLSAYSTHSFNIQIHVYS